jgi:two-component system, NarL family, response regulator DevR
MDNRTRVLIHCCNRLLRELIARLLSKKPEFDVLACEGHPKSFEAMNSMAAHVVVLDSLELYLDGARTDCPKGIRSQLAKYVLIAMNDDHGDFLAAVRSGARGYVLQDASATDVVAAIRTVASGQAACPSGYASVLFDYVAGRTHESPNSRRRAQWGLTRREQQLIPLIGRGLTNKEIASHFSLSERTVKNHIHRILKKVGAADRLGLYEVWQNRTPSLSNSTVEY